MSYPKIIAVDFDGTLVTNKHPDIGEPIPETIAALKAEQEAGAKVILWTCRRNEHVIAATNWCRENGIHVDAVNENLPSMIEFFGEDTRKIFANAYWDDKAIDTNEAFVRETWADVSGSKGLYQVSNRGNVQKNGKLCHQIKNHDGYLMVSITVDGVRTQPFVHRLVAEAFLPNPERWMDVNHKDLNKENNDVRNLEFCTHEENCRHRSAHATWTKRVRINGTVISITELSAMTRVKRDTLKHQLASLGERRFVEKIMEEHGEEIARQVPVPNESHREEDAE